MRGTAILRTTLLVKYAATDLGVRVVPCSSFLFRDATGDRDPEIASPG